MSVKDICEISGILQSEEESKSKHEMELLQLEGAIEVQEKRLDQEISNFDDMLIRKKEIESSLKSLLDKMDIAATKLCHVANERKQGFDEEDITQRLNRYLNGKNVLLTRIGETLRLIKELEQDYDVIILELEKGYAHQLVAGKAILKNEEISLNDVNDLIAISEHNLGVETENQQELGRTIQGQKELLVSIVAEIEEKKNDVLILRSELRKSREMFSSQSQSMNESKARLQQDEEQLNYKLTALRNKSDENNENYSSSVAQKANMSQKCESLQQVLIRIESEIQDRRVALQEKKASATVAEGRLSEAKHGLALAHSEKDSQDKRAAILRNQKAQYPALSALESQVNAIKSDIAESQFKIDQQSLDLSGGACDGPLTELHKQIKDCLLSKQGLLEEMERLQTKLKSACASSSEISGKLLSLRESLSESTALLEEMRQLNTKLANETSQLVEKDRQDAVLVEAEIGCLEQETLPGLKQERQQLEEREEVVRKKRVGAEEGMAEMTAQRDAALKARLEELKTVEKEERLRTRRRDVAAAQREVVEELHRALLEEDQSFKADFNQRETVFCQMKMRYEEEIRALREDANDLALKIGTVGRVIGVEATGALPLDQGDHAGGNGLPRGEEVRASRSVFGEIVPGRGKIEGGVSGKANADSRRTRRPK